MLGRDLSFCCKIILAVLRSGWQGWAVVEHAEAPMLNERCPDQGRKSEDFRSMRAREPFNSLRLSFSGFSINDWEIFRSLAFALPTVHSFRKTASDFA